MTSAAGHGTMFADRTLPRFGDLNICGCSLLLGANGR
jgi:hypothetical protein